MTYPIIGLAGMGGVGKSTLANMIIQNNGFVRGSFADPIRLMIYALGVTEDDTRDPVKKNQPHPKLNGKTPVYAMETLGTKWGRELMGEDFWLNRALDSISRPLTIYDDIRYQNEVDGIIARGGRVFRLFDPEMEPVRDSDHYVAKLVNVTDLPVRSSAESYRIIFGQ